MPDVFDEFELDPIEQKREYNNNKKRDVFDEEEIDEGWGTTVLRYLSQPLTGWAQGFTYPLDLLKMLGEADIYDPEDLERLERISEREGIPFDKEAYYRAAEEASNLFPNQSNLERIIEEQTGYPLEAKTRGQKALKFAGTAGKFSPKGYTLKGLNTPLNRPILGAGVSAANEGLKELGVAERFSEPLSFLALKRPTNNTLAARATETALPNIPNPSAPSTKQINPTIPPPIPEAQLAKSTLGINQPPKELPYLPGQANPVSVGGIPGNIVNQKMAVPVKVQGKKEHHFTHLGKDYIKP